jgi:hypothetical protein
VRSTAGAFPIQALELSRLKEPMGIGFRRAGYFLETWAGIEGVSACECMASHRRCSEGWTRNRFAGCSYEVKRHTSPGLMEL